MNCVRALALIGLALSGAGTILLWRSSPTGYTVGSFYDGTPGLPEKNRKMAFGQKVAIVAIILGALCQAAAALLT